MVPPVRKRESGYALLFIFLTVAIVGIMYYAAMPHVVFEAQRDQEQLLIDRGEQYMRGIQLYYRKFRKYPQKIEDLENTSGQRFLRQRYKDPMTGKEEWRPIHIGPNGQFIDSLTQKTNQKKQDPASVNNFITELKPLGETANTAAAPVNLGLRRRPSDAGGNGGQNGDPNLDLPVNPSDLDEQTPVVGLENADAGPAGAIVPGGQLTNPNNPNGPNGFNGSGFNVNGVPNNGFNSNGANSGGFNPNANNFDPTNPNNGGANQNQIPSGPNMIRNLLTSPRPGGPPPGIFPGSNVPGNNAGNSGFNQPTDGSSISQTNQFPQPSTTTNVSAFNGAAGGGIGGNGLSGTNGVGTNGGSTVGTALGTPVGAQGGFGGGGIAGFASKAERPGIKIYNEKQKYNEWEFIYDFAKDKTMGGGQTIPTQTGNGLNGSGTGAAGSSAGGGLGSQSGSGSGFGTSGGNSLSSPSTPSPAQPTGP